MAVFNTLFIIKTFIKMRTEKEDLRFIKGTYKNSGSASYFRGKAPQTIQDMTWMMAHITSVTVVLKALGTTTKQQTEKKGI